MAVSSRKDATEFTRDMNKIQQRKKLIDITQEFFDLHTSRTEAFDKKTTALHEAADLGDLSEIKRLVENGADITAEDECKITPVAYFLSSGNFDCKEGPEILSILAKDQTLLTKQHDLGYPIFDAMAYGNKYLLRTLLQMGIDLSFTDEDGCTFLFYLVVNENPELFQEFEDLEFDIDVQNNEKDTPLHKASALGNVEAVRFFLDRKANLNFIDNQGFTPLDLARDSYEDLLTENHKQCWDMLEAAAQKSKGVK